MKYAVFGAGPIGGTVAGYIYRAGQDVVLIDPAEPITKAIQENGLRIKAGTTAGGERKDYDLKIRAELDAENVDPVDVVIVSVKSSYTRSVLPGLKKICHDKTIVLSIQNGLGNTDIIQEVVSADRVGYGAVYFGGKPIGPGILESNVTYAEPYVFTGVTEASADMMKKISDEIRPAGFNMVYRDKAEVDLLFWNKLAMNVVVNTLGAIYMGPMDSLGSLENGIDLQEKMLKEVCAVANAKGIPLKPADIKTIPHTVTPKITKGYRHFASMCRDVYNHRKTENEFLCGAIVREGEKLGIPTPYTEACYLILSIIEDTYDDEHNPTL